MGRLAGAFLIFLGRSANAQSAPVAAADPPEPAVPDDLARLVLDTGRSPVKPPEPGLIRFSLNGEYQLRYESLRGFPLDVSTAVANQKPGAIEDSTGQKNFAYHWLRLTPRLQLREEVQIVAQLDVVSGMVLGDLAHDTFADNTPRDNYDGFRNIQGRWLYAELKTNIGVFRVGQQPSHWGMGILANDGDHPSLFGDYRYGDISERMLFATKPLGKDSPLTVAIAGDLVFHDQNADLSRGDQAFQGVLAAFLEEGPNQLGIYAAYRNQTNNKTSGSNVFTYEDRLEVLALDAAAKFAAPVPGNPNAFVFGAAEAALVVGSTNLERTQDQARNGNDTSVRSYGGAAQLGIVHRRKGPATTSYGEKDPAHFGDLVGTVEVGYASGDADPYDGTEKRFTFNSNHKVGLLLFDEVMRFQTARAASAAQDPLLSNANRPTPGVQQLSSNGAVFGAQYINPTVVYRPRYWLDFKGGMVVAQTTADYVDPYRLATKGAYTNYRGGDPAKHDLGVELDAGFEARIPLQYKITLMLGAQGGVLFPGGALANETGEKMKTPWLAVGRLGLIF
ncbi:MAG: hypothetical protein ABIP39_12245 [Polyangiaceae bacterium]